jgi:hypothetical protein
MESAAAPNAGACLQSCGIVRAALSAEDSGHSGIISKATHSAPLTIVKGLSHKKIPQKKYLIIISTRNLSGQVESNQSLSFFLEFFFAQQT